MQSATTMNLESEQLLLARSYRIQAWVVTLTASFFFFYTFIQLNLFNAINNELMQAFQLNAAGLGQLSSMYFYANALFLFPAGILLDRYSTKKILLFATAISALGTFVFAVATSFEVAAFARFVVGIGASFCFLGCIRTASRWFPPRKMAFVTGVVVTMAMFGGLVAQTPMALLTHLVGWRNAVLMDGFLGLIIVFLILWVFQDRPSTDVAIQKNENTAQKFDFWRSIGRVLLNPYNWFGGLYTSLMNLAVFLLGALWGIHYLVQVHHLTVVQASYATTCFFLGVIIGCPLFGWFSDYIERRVTPMVIGAILSIIVLLALLYYPHLTLYQLIGLFFLIGFVTSSQVLSYPTIAELNPLELTSTAVSIDSMTIMLSGAIVQPLFGWLMELNWDHTIVDGVRIYTAQNFMMAMLILPISCVAALFIAMLIKETYCQSQA